MNRLRPVVLVLCLSLLISVATAQAQTLTSVSPASVTSGSPQIQLTVNGTGFGPTTTLMWQPSGSPVQSLQTTFLNSIQLISTVPASLLATPDDILLYVPSTAGTGNSNALPFKIVATPSVTSIEDIATAGPTATAGGAAFQLVVNGTNFVSGSVVQWNSGSGAQSLSTVYVSATQLSAVVPAGLIAAAGTAFVDVLNPGGATSGLATFTIVAAPAPAAPTIGSGGLSPASVTVGSTAFQLTVTGTNYLSGSVVQWNSGAGAQSLATVMLSATQLTALVPAGLLTAAGPVFVTVQNPGGLSSNLATFTVTAAAAPVPPTISTGGLSPASVTAGGGSFQLGITGTGFIGASVVQWNSGAGAQSLATVMLSATQLTALVPGNLTAAQGTAFVTVQNPGVGPSNTVTFTIGAAAAPAQPTATTVMPNTVTAGSAALQITVTGTNFVNASVVQWNTGSSVQALSTVYVSATQLSALVPAGLLASAGTAFVDVLNTGGQTSGLLTFTIGAVPVAPAPTINTDGTGLSPTSVVAGGTSFTLGITGTNFVSGSVCCGTRGRVSRRWRRYL